MKPTAQLDKDVKGFNQLLIQTLGQQNDLFLFLTILGYVFGHFHTLHIFEQTIPTGLYCSANQPGLCHQTSLFPKFKDKL